MWAEKVVFDRQIVSKPRRRLLVIAHFHRKLVPARVRRLLVIGVFRVRLTAYTHREVVFWAENDVFGRQIVPKPRRRLLVIAHFHRKSFSATLRRLLAISGFWAQLIAHTHRDMRVFAEISSQNLKATQSIYHAIAITI